MYFQNKKKLENFYFKIIEYGVYLSLFTPLIFTGSYFFPFVVPKTIFFRIIVNIIFIAYILLAYSNPKYRPKITPLTLAIAVFLGVITLASVLGANFERSFWSVFERMEGLLTFFHLFGFYIILTCCFKERKYWQRALVVSILVGIFTSIYALFSDNPATRGGATLGNSSFFSAYILFNLFFAFIFFVTKKGAWRIFYGLALAVFFAALFFNPGGFTKGVVSSLGVGAVLLLTSFMFFLKNKALKVAAPFVLVFLSLVGLFIVQSFYFKGRAFDLRNIPDKSRQVVWSMGWQAWQEKFWLGWGLENFNVPFAKHFDPELPLTREIWYDRVHNIVLDMGVSSGIVGLLSYLSIFGVAIFVLIKLLPKIENAKYLTIPLGLITLLLVYFFQNLWVFDMISTYVMFFFTLAFIGFLAETNVIIQGWNSFGVRNEREEEKTFPLSSFLAGFLIVLTILFFFLGNIQPNRASKIALKGIMAADLPESISNFEKAFRISPMVKFEIPEQFSAKMTSFLFQENQDRELLRQGFGIAEQELKNSIEQGPLDFRLHLFLGRHYNNFYELTGDRRKLSLAEEVLQRALELSPTNQQSYFMFAQTKFLQNEKDQALRFLEKAVDLEPSFTQARIHLVRSYRITEKYELALSELEKMEEFGFSWQDDTGMIKEAIEIFKGAKKDTDALILLYQRGTELNPKEVVFWQGLINLYLEFDQFDKAKTTIEDFLRFNPEYASEVEEFLEKIPQQ